MEELVRYARRAHKEDVVSKQHTGNGSSCYVATDCSLQPGGPGSDPRVGTLVIKVGRRSTECQSSTR